MVVVWLTKIVVDLAIEVELFVAFEIATVIVPYVKSALPVFDVVLFAQVTVAVYVPFIQFDIPAEKLALEVPVFGF